MGTHVIVGAGPVGTTTALQLAEAGHQVIVVTRSGSGPRHAGVTLRQADASDAASLTDLSQGAEALYNCANPPYHRWATAWPPLAAAMLSAAGHSGAVLVTMSNLYGYPPGSSPMTEQTPLTSTTRKGAIRAGMWQNAVSAHRAGTLRATEARASDYFGPLVTDGGHLGARVVPRLLAGKGVRVIGDPDAPHTWTYIEDVARTLVTLATDARAWGAPWHVPSNPPRSQRQMVELMATAAGITPPKVSSTPKLLLRAVGLAVPMIRELEEVAYQFEQPFVMDSSLAEQTFGISATPLDETIRATVGYWRAQAAAAAA